MAEFNDDTPKSIRVSVIEEIIISSNTDQVIPLLKQFVASTAELLMKCYAGQISELFSGRSFEANKTRYELTLDQKELQGAKIKSILLEKLNRVFDSFNDLQVRRQYLNSQLPYLKQYMTDDLDVGALAKGFGTGVLAVTMPWLGIPAVIANQMNESKKAKEIQLHAEQFDKHFDEYLQKVDLIKKQLVSSIEEVGSYVYNKYMEINFEATVTILQHISAAGIDISYYINHSKSEIPLLESYEKKLVENNNK